jgi:hypothetical protein
MNKIATVQREIFQEIKSKLPPNVSLVFEITEVLGLSQDSAYRRIRGEKPLTPDELFKLKDHFNLSLDQFGSENSNNVNFNCSAIGANTFKVTNWLEKVYADLLQINAMGKTEIVYAAKDPPLFHYFQLPEIAAFKVFFWEKTLFQFPEYEEKMFSFNEISDDTFQKGRKTLAMAAKIPTIEIWNEQTFKILLSQIEFYWVSGFFSNKDDFFNLLDKTEKWIHHIQKETEYGFKYLYGTPPEGVENNFILYVNEVVLNDNTILVRTDRGYSAYLTFNVLSLLHTTNQTFCMELDRYFRGILRKSNRISVSGAKERNRFFSEQLHAVQKLQRQVV